MSRATLRWIVLVAVLALTVWASWRLSSPESSVQPAAPVARAPIGSSRPATQAAGGEGDGPVGALVLRTRTSAAGVRDLFALPDVPRPVSVRAAPPAPQAPPRLPFRFIGRIEEGSGVRVFLGDGDDTLVVSAGERVAKGWRLDAVYPDRLQFVFESSGFQQTLHTGAD